jgi:hypothetical protein
VVTFSFKHESFDVKIFEKLEYCFNPLIMKESELAVVLHISLAFKFMHKVSPFSRISLETVDHTFRDLEAFDSTQKVEHIFRSDTLSAVSFNKSVEIIECLFVYISSCFFFTR